MWNDVFWVLCGMYTDGSRADEWFVRLDNLQRVFQALFLPVEPESGTSSERRERTAIGIGDNGGPTVMHNYGHFYRQWTVNCNSLITHIRCICPRVYLPDCSVYISFLLFLTIKCTAVLVFFILLCSMGTCDLNQINMLCYVMLCKTYCNSNSNTS